MYAILTVVARLLRASASTRRLGGVGSALRSCEGRNEGGRSKVTKERKGCVVSCCRRPLPTVMCCTVVWQSDAQPIPSTLSRVGHPSCTAPKGWRHMPSLALERIRQNSRVQNSTSTQTPRQKFAPTLDTDKMATTISHDLAWLITSEFAGRLGVKGRIDDMQRETAQRLSRGQMVSSSRAIL